MTPKKKRVSITVDYLETLKEDLKYERKKLEDLRADREKYRRFYLQLLKDNTSWASKNEYCGPQGMILRLSKLLNDVEGWYWG